jgi:cysteine desulfurase/selenocysteine lyase
VIYFDNAATSWPKPDCVRAAFNEYFGEAGGNPGRSGHRMSIAAGRVMEHARELVATLFRVQDPSRIIFANNATHALNQAIYGLFYSGQLKPGDHVLTTGMEHNSVMRPLRHLQLLGVEITAIDCAIDGSISVEQMRAGIRQNTRLVVSTHASNVTGEIMPIAEIASVTRERGVLFLVDAAQTAGTVPFSVQALSADLVAFTGHKGLLGPTGTGGLYVREGLTLEPLMRGGTGSQSAMETQPEFLPDAYESGTPNVAGIAGLAAGVRYLLDLGVEAVRHHERELVMRFEQGVAKSEEITLYGPRDLLQRCGIVSFNVNGASPSEVVGMLDESFDILARPGLQCAPAAHRTLLTFPQGTVRFSFGWFNTASEIDAALDALRQIADWAASGATSHARESR